MMSAGQCRNGEVASNSVISGLRCCRRRQDYLPEHFITDKSRPDNRRPDEEPNTQEGPYTLLRDNVMVVRSPIIYARDDEAEATVVQIDSVHSDSSPSARASPGCAGSINGAIRKTTEDWLASVCPENPTSFEHTDSDSSYRGPHAVAGFSQQDNGPTSVSPLAHLAPVAARNATLHREFFASGCQFQRHSSKLLETLNLAFD